MPIKRRARHEEQKIERRQAILEAAAALWCEHPGQLASMAEIAKRCGLAKGTVYLYFQTKEELFLAVLTEQIEGWFAALEVLLQNPGLTLERLSDATCAYVAERPELMRLASLSNGVLERNIDEATAYQFKQHLAQRLRSLAESLSLAFPGLSLAKGQALLLASYALLLGLWQMVDVAPTMQTILQREELAVFRIEFASTAQHLLRALWRGFFSEVQPSSS